MSFIKNKNLIKLIIILFALIIIYFIIPKKQNTKLITNRTNRMVIGNKADVITYQENASSPLDIKTAYNTNEATHPSVVNFNTKWHGYKYWMAVTPYPKADYKKENPHIVVSNDLINWDAPKGLTNPIDKPVLKNKRNGYNSDTHLIYNKDKDRIEVFWRYVNKVDNSIKIFYKYSYDGIKYSDKILSYQGVLLKEDMLSPAIVLDNGLYQMWYVNDDYKVHYRTSKDAVNWSSSTEIKIDYKLKQLSNWHIDVQKNNGVYEMLIVAFSQTSNKRKPRDRANMSLYYTKSSDNVLWSDAIEIIRPSNKKAWDDRGLYRSCLIKNKDQYIVFYSGISYEKQRGIGLSYGKDITRLKGLSDNYKEFIE